MASALHNVWGFELLTIYFTAKVKDRFATFFEYHELALELPAITAQMEQDAQTLGAWKAKALSGSEDGSPNSFINKRGRSKSVETSASWDLPVWLMSLLFVYVWHPHCLSIVATSPCPFKL